MREEYAKLAYHGKPVPDGLPEEEVPAYIMLCELYRLHKAGEIPADTAAILKKPIMEYPNCPVMERASLLRYFFPNALGRAQKGEKTAWEEAMQLFEEYAKIPLDTWTTVL